MRYFFQWRMDRKFYRILKRFFDWILSLLGSERDPIIKISVSEDDTYSLDDVLSPIIAASLKKFKETVESSDVKSHPMDIEFDEWMKMLDDMIYAFDSDLDYDEGDISPFHRFKPDMDALEASEIEDKKTKRVKTHWERVKKGRLLFAERYRDLWR